jgi:hypothetical protein
MRVIAQQLYHRHPLGMSSFDLLSEGREHDEVAALLAGYVQQLFLGQFEGFLPVGTFQASLTGQQQASHLEVASAHRHGEGRHVHTSSLGPVGHVRASGIGVGSGL